MLYNEIMVILWKVGEYTISLGVLDVAIKCKIKIILVQKDITQKEFAERLGVSPQQANNWISGRTIPRMETLIRMSEVLGCTINDFYELK